MDDAAAVSLLERTGDLRAVSNDVGDWQRTAREPIGNGFALDQLHDQIVGVILMSDVVQRADMRMVELRDHFRFTLEARSALRVCGERSGKNLDRYVAVKTRVTRAVDLPHPARAYAREDLVRTET